MVCVGVCVCSALCGVEAASIGVASPGRRARARAWRTENTTRKKGKANEKNGTQKTAACPVRYVSKITVSRASREASALRGAFSLGIAARNAALFPRAATRARGRSRGGRGGDAANEPGANPVSIR